MEKKKYVLKQETKFTTDCSNFLTKFVAVATKLLGKLQINRGFTRADKKDLWLICP